MAAKAGKIEKGREYSKCGDGGERLKGNERLEKLENWRGRGRVKAAKGKNLSSACARLGKTTPRTTLDVELKLLANQRSIGWI